MIHFSSVANDGIGDTRLSGMSEEQLYHHESVHKITQSCNRRLAGDSSQFKFHMLEPKEIAVVSRPNLNFTKNTGHDLIPPKILKIASRCIEFCDWPLQWKKGDWVPVLKKDNKQGIKLLYY